MTEEQTNNEEPQTQDEQAQERPEPVNVAEYQAEVQRLRDDLAKVRKEAADRRVKAKELEDKLAQTKSLDEYNALKEELAAAARKAEHDRLVATYAGSLPDDLKSSVSWPEDEDGIKAADVRAACEKEGLLVLTAKTRLRLLPPLILTETDVDAALDTLRTVLEKF